ncbi:MAG: hypothetical protein JWM78_275 [Verrucomicrobiaceae bacterium]|nr:hypothetical protein [Verrucomicrobiaceae bacterium]
MKKMKLKQWLFFNVRNCVVVALSVVASFSVQAATAPAQSLVVIPGIEPAYCLKVAKGAAQANPAKCPGFMTEGLAASAKECGEVGGTLNGEQQGTVYSVDIDGDGQPEYLWQFNANFACEGAASYFSCGSSSCPFALVRRQSGEGMPKQSDEQWRALGTIPITSSITPVPNTGVPHFPDLQIGCEESSFCDTALLHWNGEQYESISVVLHSVTVTLFPSSALVSPPQAVGVLASPARNSTVIGNYGADAIFAVLGHVVGTAYLLVSPCNACAAGFIERQILYPNPSDK